MREQVVIQNKSELAGSVARIRALELIETGLSAVLPGKLLPAGLSFDPATRTFKVNGDEYRLAIKGRLFVVGGGKAAGLMAQALELVTGPDAITAGVVVTKGSPGHTSCIQVLSAGHPLPDEQGVDATQKIFKLEEEYRIGSGDIVLCLISGGASALMPAPPDGISLDDKRRITSALMRSGADISEINVVRKHLSRIKGGWLGKHFSPATMISLIISDVVGDDPATIASGPTAVDVSTFADTLAIFNKYRLMNELPPEIANYLEKGLSGLVPETPKVLENCRNYVIGNVGTALKAMAAKAELMGMKTLIITDAQTGDTAEVAKARVRDILNGKFAGYDLLLSGGETTLALPSETGIGGRNQHYTAVSLAGLAASTGNWLVAGIGTDGSDYISGIAGALVDNETAVTVKRLGIKISDYIVGYDSYSLFASIGRSLVRTGDTGTNVGDIMLYLFI